MAVGRNDLCPCESGKKYKKCCLDKDREAVPVTGPDGKLPPGARMVEHNGQRYVTTANMTPQALESVADFFEQKRRGKGPAQQIADFAQPLLDAARGETDKLQRAFSLGAMFWNLAITKDEKLRDEMLDDLVRRTQKTEEDAREFRALAAEMLERHRQMFPEMHR